jgi:hypothetical protein
MHTDNFIYLILISARYISVYSVTITRVSYNNNSKVKVR